MTFLTDLDDLIRYHHGDVKKLREIRNTIRHDNFITTEDKNYVQSLVDEHLRNQPLEKTHTTRKSQILELNFKQDLRLGIQIHKVILRLIFHLIKI